MRIIHTADLHLDSPLTAHLCGEAAVQRRREVDGALRRVVEDGIRRGGEAVLIAGDLFDSKDCMPYTVDDVVSFIRDKAPLPFFYVAGNHEGTRLSERTDLPDNLHVFDQTRHTYSLSDGITVHGVCSPSALCSLPLDPNSYNIVLLHAAVGERTSDTTLRLSDLNRCAVDYLALGHYHAFQTYTVGDRLTAAYSGTPEGRGYDECGDKGYALLDTDRREVTFVKTALRRVEDITADISEAASSADIVHTVRLALAKRDVAAQDMVRVTLTGFVAPELRRDMAELSGYFSDYRFSFTLRDACRLRIDKDSLMFDPTLKGELIRTVLDDASLSEKEKDGIINCALRYLLESGR